MKSRIIQVACIVVGVVAVFMSFFAVSARQASVSAQSVENRREIERLQSELEALQNAEVDSVEEVTQSMSLAEDLGNEVAEAQTRMHNGEASDDATSSADYVGERLAEDSQKYRSVWAGGVTDKMRWEFVTPNNYVSANLGAVWLGYSEEDGALLAYVTGSYDEAANQFSGLSLRMTSAGNKRVGVTPGETGGA